jgi:peptidoglycan/LPS O-acetylase OafA/YrhL
MTNNPTKEESKRLTVLRFPLIVIVVMIHANTKPLLGREKLWGADGFSTYAFFVDALRHLISSGIGQAAVPLFFLISGYFFYLNAEASWGFFKKQFLSRTRTLLVPLLFWNLLLIALLWTISQLFPAKNTPVWGSLDLNDGQAMMNATFGIGRQPIVYPFWFIRDLLVMVLASPFIFWIIQRIGWLFPTTLFIFWLLRPPESNLPSPGALLFFATGAYIGINRLSAFHLDKWRHIFWFFYLLSLLCDPMFLSSSKAAYLARLQAVLGAISILSLTKFAIGTPALEKWLIKLAGASFFLFATHEPTLSIIRKITERLLSGTSPLWVLCQYFVSAIATVITLTLLYYFLSKKLPRFTKIITGGR